MAKRVIVTGGAGFIGSALVRLLIQERDYEVLNLDKLTYAGNLDNVKCVADSPRYHFVQADIVDPKVADVFKSFQPDTIIHLAAESHVDRSIDGPMEFVRTNLVGTANLLDIANRYRKESGKEDFVFQHISTDEVYGSLGNEGFFTEKTHYDPSSPYSASKAGSDFLVRAWGRTFGMKVKISNCSNNYGSYHFPEKLIPLVILNALDGKPLPVFGQGANIRDWLYVEDHARALLLINEKGEPGETYNIGGHNERSNIQVVQGICDILDELQPRKDGRSYAEQITFVSDRPGHDLRYAIDPTKIVETLGWKPRENFTDGLKKTVKWYLENEWWWKPIRMRYAGERLGKGEAK